MLADLKVDGYFYIVGSDNLTIEDELLRFFREMEAELDLNYFRIVNHVSDQISKVFCDGLPHWALGVNFDFVKTSASGVEGVWGRFQNAAKRFNREFVMGYFDYKAQENHELGVISAQAESHAAGLGELLRSHQILVNRYGT